MSWQLPGQTRRKRGWIRVLVGLALIVAGGAAIVFGVVDIINERDRIEDDAVARGFMGETVSFTAEEPGDYTVYRLSGGDVSGTACLVSSGGASRTLSGARQDVEYTLGSAQSIGRFDAGAGDVQIRCDPQGPFEYIVSPGAPGIISDVLALIGGAFAIFAGIGLLIWGLIGKRVPA